LQRETVRKGVKSRNHNELILLPASFARCSVSPDLADMQIVFWMVTAGT